jgi:hypothetical protein
VTHPRVRCWPLPRAPCARPDRPWTWKLPFASASNPLNVPPIICATMPVAASRREPTAPFPASGALVVAGQAKGGPMPSSAPRRPTPVRA